MGIEIDQMFDSAVQESGEMDRLSERQNRSLSSSIFWVCLNSRSSTSQNRRFEGAMRKPEIANTKAGHFPTPTCGNDENTIDPFFFFFEFQNPISRPTIQQPSIFSPPTFISIHVFM
jgi:hypothetical protein